MENYQFLYLNFYRILPVWKTTKEIIKVLVYDTSVSLGIKYRILPMIIPIIERINHGLQNVDFEFQIPNNNAHDLASFTEESLKIMFDDEIDGIISLEIQSEIKNGIFEFNCDHFHKNVQLLAN